MRMARTTNSSRNRPCSISFNSSSRGRCMAVAVVEARTDSAVKDRDRPAAAAAAAAVLVDILQIRVREQGVLCRVARLLVLLGSEIVSAELPSLSRSFLWHPTAYNSQQQYQPSPQLQAQIQAAALAAQAQAPPSQLQHPAMQQAQHIHQQQAPQQQYPQQYPHSIQQQQQPYAQGGLQAPHQAKGGMSGYSASPGAQRLQGPTQRSPSPNYGAGRISPGRSSPGIAQQSVMQGVQSNAPPSPGGSGGSSSSKSAGAADKGADYVYFERSTQGMSKTTLDAATGAKLKLEHFYKIAVEQAIERSNRCVHVRWAHYPLTLLYFLLSPSLIYLNIVYPLVSAAVSSWKSD